MAIKGFQPRKTVADILRERKAVADDQLAAAEAEARASGKPIQTVLIEKGFIGKAALLGLLADEWKAAAVDLAAIDIDEAAAKVIPAAVARRHMVIPFEMNKETLWLAMADPLDFFVAEDVQLRTGHEVTPVLALPADIAARIKQFLSDESAGPSEGGGSGGSDEFMIKYGLPDAPRKHLLVLQGGSMEICDSQESAVARLNELGRGRVSEVWEMRKRTVVPKSGRRPLMMSELK